MNYKRGFYVAVLTLIICGFVFSQSDALASPSGKNPRAAALVKEALALETRGLLPAAIAKYLEVLKLEPKDFAAMNSIAGLYGMLQQPADEVVWAQKAIETNPNFWKALINLGNGLAMQGKFDPSIKAFQKAAEMAPKDPLPIYSLGVVAENRDQITEALAYYKASIELDPRFENGLFSAAAMHARLRQFVEARALLKHLIELNPRDAEARGMLQAVEREIAKP